MRCNNKNVSSIRVYLAYVPVLLIIPYLLYAGMHALFDVAFIIITYCTLTTSMKNCIRVLTIPTTKALPMQSIVARYTLC